MSDYARNFDEAKRMSFLIEGDKMLEKYNKSGIQSAIKIKSYEVKIKYNFP